LKKFEGDDGWDFDATKNSHRNDQPIPELPEPRGPFGKRNFSFLGFHESTSGYSPFLSEKQMQIELIFCRKLDIEILFHKTMIIRCMYLFFS